MNTLLKKWLDFCRENTVKIDLGLLVFFTAFLILTTYPPEVLSGWTDNPLQDSAYLFALGPALFLVLGALVNGLVLSLVLWLRTRGTKFLFYLRSTLVIFCGCLSLSLISFVFLRLSGLNPPVFFTIVTLILPFLFFVYGISLLTNFTPDSTPGKQLFLGASALWVFGLPLLVPPGVITGSPFDYLTILTALVIYLAFFFYLLYWNRKTGKLTSCSVVGDGLLAATSTCGLAFFLTAVALLYGSLAPGTPEVAHDMSSYNPEPEKVERYERLASIDQLDELNPPDGADTETQLEWYRELPGPMSEAREILLEGPHQVPPAKLTEFSSQELEGLLSLIDYGRVLSTVSRHHFKQDEDKLAAAAAAELVKVASSLMRSETFLIHYLVGLGNYNMAFTNVRDLVRREPRMRNLIRRELDSDLFEPGETNFLKIAGLRGLRFWQLSINEANSSSEISRGLTALFVNLEAWGAKIFQFFKKIWPLLGRPAPAARSGWEESVESLRGKPRSIFLSSLKHPRTPQVNIFRRAAIPGFKGYVTEDIPEFHAKANCLASLLLTEAGWKRRSKLGRTNFLTGKPLNFRDQSCLELGKPAEDG